jgi:hypothetical protein
MYSMGKDGAGLVFEVCVGCPVAEGDGGTVEVEVGEEVGRTTVKCFMPEVPMLPSVLLAYRIKLWSPSAMSERDVFPKRVTLVWSSKL